MFHFDIEGADDELKLIKYHQGGFYGWHTDFNAGSCSNRKLVAIVQLTDPSEYEGGDVQKAADIAAREIERILD